MMPMSLAMMTGKKVYPEIGLGEGVVLMLSEPLKGLQCEVYIDNFFNSPVLQERLATLDILSCGTVRSNRKYMPKAFTSDKKMKRGDIENYSADKVSCVKWMDNRAVMLLSNFISPEEHIMVKRRKAGTADRIEVKCPEMVARYNKYMGGVDLMDQLKISYQCDRKSTKKFYLRLLFDVMDIAMNNACIVYNDLMKAENSESKPVTTLEFREDVATKLIGKYSSRQRDIPMTSKKTKISSILPASQPRHSLRKGIQRRRCVVCSENGVESRTNNYCDVCEVYLCFTNQRDCFAAHHNR